MLRHHAWEDTAMLGLLAVAGLHAWLVWQVWVNRGTRGFESRKEV